MTISSSLAKALGCNDSRGQQLSLSIANAPTITEVYVVASCADSRDLSPIARELVGHWLCKDDRILRRGGIYHMQRSPEASEAVVIEVVSLRPFNQGRAVEGKTRIIALPKKEGTCPPASPLASTETLEDVEFTIDETFLASSISRITPDLKHPEVKLTPKMTVGELPHQYDSSCDVFVSAGTLGRLGIFDHGWVRIYRYI